MSGLTINLHFSGGAELLFDKIKKRTIDLPVLRKFNPEVSHDHWTMQDFLQWIKANLLRERPDLFMQGDSVRPGILVLVNDADWELCGELSYELKDRDDVMFISTLHGG